MTPQARRRTDVPLPRQLARSLRPPVRAEAVAVHHRRRQRIDACRRRARRLRPPARRRHGRQRSTCGCSTTRSGTRRRSGSRSTGTSCASRTCSWSARTRSCGSAARSGCTDQRIALQARRRREPRHSPGLLPRRARLGPRRADRGGDGPLYAAGVLRAARPSPTAASATSRCRIRSTRSTASFASIRAACGSTM